MQLTATKLRAEMRARGWSAADLAQQLGCSVPAVYHWLSGAGEPKRYAQKIADILNGHEQSQAEPEPQTSQPQAMAVARCRVDADGLLRISLHADGVKFEGTALAWETACGLLRGLARNGHKIAMEFE